MDNNNVIITKQDIRWHIIEAYLEGLLLLNIYTDDELYKLFLQMREYVDSKLKFCGRGDVIEECVVVKQEPIDEEEYQNWINNKR